jgi:FSR family fosmidomycin resistance protein-like MFS transporter
VSRRIWLWGTAHAVDDLYQGLVPATLPYFVLDRHYGYVAASGLTLAAALGSSVPQPFVGILADRYRVGWMASAGVATAGIGLGLAGLASAYEMVWILILISGLGVAMFHPAAGKAAREAAGDSASAMSIFAAGGKVGFFLAPVLATPVLIRWGAPATVLFIPPAVVIALILLRQHRRGQIRQKARDLVGDDRWLLFGTLTAIEVVRSTTFFGINTFIELYWIRYLHLGRTAAGAALACFLVGGVAGTLIGGRIADRYGMVRTTRFGALIAVPPLIALRLSTGPIAPLICAIAAGIALNIPFAVLVKLGQDYLPRRPGTAAGVTLGLAVSIGGLIAPVLGVIAQHRGPQGVLSVLCLTPVLALVLGLALKEPQVKEPQVLATKVGKL